MDIRKIKKLIDLVKEQGIGEIEIKEGEESVRISQLSQLSLSPTEPPHHSSKSIATPPNTPKALEEKTTPTNEQNPSNAEEKHIIRSPMIGTFYLSPTPNADPFVAIGQSIKPGDVLCIVEAMKMFNQIESDCSGKIKSCLVENGQPVEYGQALFIVE